MHPFLTNYVKRKVTGPSDPYFNNVTLLLHCDGSDGSTTVTDVKGHSVTAINGAEIDTAQSKFGGASLRFDGSSCAYLADSADWDMDGNFTIELWFKNDGSKSGTLIGTYDDNTYPTGSWAIQMWNGYVWFNHGSRFGSTDDLGSTSSYTSDTDWHHLAVVRSGTAITLYIDGTSVDTGTLSGTIGALTELRLGAMYTTRGSEAWKGWLDDVRITKGVARTISGAPTAAYPDQ